MKRAVPFQLPKDTIYQKIILLTKISDMDIRKDVDGFTLHLQLISNGNVLQEGTFSPTWPRYC